MSVLNFTPTQRRQRQYEVYLSPAKRRSMTLQHSGRNGARGQPLRALSTRGGILLIGVICYSTQCIAELNATSQRYFQTLCSSMRPRCSIVYCRSRRPCPVLSMAIVCSICYFCLHTPCAITLYHQVLDAHTGHNRYDSVDKMDKEYEHLSFVTCFILVIFFGPFV